MTIGSYVYTFEQTNPISSSNYILIFGKGTNSGFQKGIIHNLKITTNGQIHNFVPCFYKEAKTVGLLYDETTNEVYGSSEPRCEFIIL